MGAWNYAIFYIRIAPVDFVIIDMYHLRGELDAKSDF